MDLTLNHSNGDMMKSFKSIRKIINETFQEYTGFSRRRVGPLDSDNSMDFNQNLAQLNPSEIDRFNIYLGALSSKPYLDPNQAFREVHSKLSITGLHFDVDWKDDLRKSGERVYPLSLFGGSFGSDGKTYGTSTDDNIERKLGHKLGLMVTSTPTSTGMTTLRAEVIPM
jgi:hypothetical protein